LGQRRRDEQRTAFERIQYQIAELVRFRRRFGQLHVVLGQRRLVPRSGIAVDPLGSVHDLAALRHLLLAQHVGYVQHHGLVPLGTNHSRPDGNAPPVLCTNGARVSCAVFNAILRT
jgi:hypothetical protein